MNKIKAELLTALESVVTDENELTAWIMYVKFMATQDDILFLYCDYRTNGQAAASNEPAQMSLF